MDPNATWKRFLDACSIEDRETQDALVDLCHWLNRGGAAPEGVAPGVVHSLRVWLGPDAGDEEE